MSYFQEPENSLKTLKKQAAGHLRHLPENSKQYVKSLFPILSWMPRYNLQWFIGDFIAGVTVALVVIPQSISYSTKLANLPAQFGLYTSFIGCLIYALFATSKGLEKLLRRSAPKCLKYLPDSHADVTIGATAVLSLLVGRTIQQYLPNASEAEAITFAISLSFWIGILQLTVGLLKLGLIVDFVPIPVFAGITSGAVIQIIIQQLPGLLGIPGINTNNAPYRVLYDVASSLAKTSLYDMLFGIISLILLFIIKHTFAHLAIQRPSVRHIGYLRNAIVLAVATGISFFLRDSKSVTFAIVKTIPYGLSGVRPANLSLPYAATVFPAIPALFIVSILEHIAVVRSFGRVNGYTTDANQEIVAIGLTNLIGSFVGAFPATGSFSRSAIKSASGVRTPFGTFITGVLVVFGLFTLTNVLYWIPTAVLSAIVIGAIFDLFNFSIVTSLLKIAIADFVGFWIAVIVTLCASIEVAIYASVGWSIIVLLFRIARPEIKVLSRTRSGEWVPQVQGFTQIGLFSAAPQGILVFKIDESLTYPNSAYFVDRLKEIVLTTYSYTGASVSKGDRLWNDDTEQRAIEHERQGFNYLPPLRAVVLDFSSVGHLDYTGLQALFDAQDEVERFAGRVVPFHFVNVRHHELYALLHVPIIFGGDADKEYDKPGGVGGFLKRNRKDPEAAIRKRERRVAALEYFHLSVDSAVKAADAETRVVFYAE
ncbi:hypothetical protein HDU98_006342 [Podochytrium sp. JEL0797]|nr:hypothetical protein HDU98_006342 [Podochytrium sp. JEL0797]